MAETGRRILVVDDDRAFRATVRLALEARGYEVIEAADGAEGLALTERDAPDLVILDVVMPRRSGFLLLDRIHRSPFLSPKVVLVTAGDDPRFSEFARSRGADAFLLKPFELAELLDTISRLLDDPDKER